MELKCFPLGYLIEYTSEAVCLGFFFMGKFFDKELKLLIDKGLFTLLFSFCVVFAKLYFPRSLFISFSCQFY